MCGNLKWCPHDSSEVSTSTSSTMQSLSKRKERPTRFQQCRQTLVEDLASNPQKYVIRPPRSNTEVKIKGVGGVAYASTIYTCLVANTSKVNKKHMFLMGSEWCARHGGFWRAMDTDPSIKPSKMKERTNEEVTNYKQMKISISEHISKINRTTVKSPIE